MLASMLERQEKPEAALAELQAAVRLMPDQPALHLYIGRLCLQQQQYAEAETAFLRGTELQPDNPTGFFLLGVADLALARYELAEQSLQHALELNPDLTAARFQLIKAWTQQGKFPKALKVLNKMLQKQPEASAVHRWKGDVFTAMGEFEKAIVAYRSAIEFGDALRDRYPELVPLDGSGLEEQALAEQYRAIFVRVAEQQAASKRAERGTRSLSERRRGDSGPAQAAR
jgi:tetratricopeptide (TPR) repeat protein